MVNERLKVLVIDDSALYRQMIRNVLRDIDGVEVVGVAKNGHEALAKIAALQPDAITLDYEMPDLDGIQVLKRVKRYRHQPKAIMVSSYTEEGAKVTTDALLEGAFDFVRKPTGGDPVKNRDELRLALLDKLAPIAESMHRSASMSAEEPESVDVSAVGTCDAVVIASSTGGPVALRQLLTRLPGSLHLPVIVVQHMPTQFTAPLARRLNEACQLEVLETSEAMRIRPGAVYIAHGGFHTKLTRRHQHVIARLTEEPPENSCRPAADYTLRYAVEVYEGRVCAVVLTGMGHDGTKGCEAVKSQGGFVIAQHPHECAVHGMPKSVIDAQLADQVLPLSKIATLISQLK